MGKKITQYPNNVSTNPDNLSLLDLSEKTGASTFESRKWNLTAFKAWVNSWVVAGAVAWNDITGKPTGTVNKVAKFTTTTDIGDSTITDDGTLVGISQAVPTAKLHINNEGLQDSFRVDDQASDTTPFIIKDDGRVVIGSATPYLASLSILSTQQNAINVTTTSEFAGGVLSTSSSPNGYAKGGDFDATASGTASWVKGVVGEATANNYAYSIGGEFSATSVTGQDYAVGVKAVATSPQFTKYCFWGQDTTQGEGKFLKSVTSDGKANWAYIPKVIQLAVSDETTALTTGTTKIVFRMPYFMKVTEVRASLTTAQTSGNILTVDINEGVSSFLSTKLTIDNTERTSVTATTPAVISDDYLPDDSEITVDIDQIGDGTAKGLKITLIGY